MKKMLIFWNTNTNISSSTDANSGFGNIVTAACANAAREEEEEEEEKAGWLHFCDGEESAEPSRKRPRAAWAEAPGVTDRIRRRSRNSSPPAAPCGIGKRSGWEQQSCG